MLLAKVVGAEEADDEGADRPHQPPAQLDQMVEQRHRLVVDRIVFDVGHLRLPVISGQTDGRDRRCSTISGGMKAGASGSPAAADARHDPQTCARTPDPGAAPGWAE